MSESFGDFWSFESEPRSTRRTGMPARRRGVRAGAALAEFALVMPLLLLIFVFMIDFGRAFVIGKAIDNAATQGALMGAMTTNPSGTNTMWVGTVNQAIRQSLSGYGWYDDTRLTVNVPIPSSLNGLVDSNGSRIVQVNVTYAADHVLRLPGVPSGYSVIRTVRVDQIR